LDIRLLASISAVFLLRYRVFPDRPRTRPK
jgi:hypothetical protein